MTGTKPGKRHIGIALLIICALLGVLAAAMDTRKAAHVLRHADWRWVPVALVATALSYFCLSAGYGRINRIFGIRLRRVDLLEIGFVSFALNNLVSTGGLAGYSLRVILLRRRGAALGDVVGASLLHSYFNNLVMMSLLPVGLVYLLVNHPLGPRRTLELSVATAATVGLLVGITILLFSSRERGRLIGAFGRLARMVLRRDVEPMLRDLHAQLERAIQVIRRRPAVLGAPLLFVAVDWAASVFVLGACFAALHTAVHPGVLITGFAFGITAGYLSMLPGGLGVQEASMTGIYVLLGVEYEQAVLAATLFRVVYYVIPFVLSLHLYARILRRTGSLEPA
jgi:uncharacterized protein (TIRG00374 family)